MDSKLPVTCLVIIIFSVFFSFFKEPVKEIKPIVIEKRYKEVIKKEEPKEEQVNEEPEVIEQPVVQEEQIYSTGIPVLNYHFFYNDGNNNCGETICLAKSKLEEHLKYLTENGFKTLTMQEFIDWYEGRIEVPYKSVLITIDDGAMGTSFINGNILIPLLEQYKVHATLFLITAWWDKANYKSDYLEVESHGHDIHVTGECGRAKLQCLNYDQLYNDLKTSMDILGSNKSFCFPFYTSSGIAPQVLQNLGVKVAFGGGGYNATRSSNRYYIPRYPIYDDITMEQFINMVN